jgi:hypothetical protein
MKRRSDASKRIIDFLNKINTDTAGGLFSRKKTGPVNRKGRKTDRRK